MSADTSRPLVTVRGRGPSLRTRRLAALAEGFPTEADYTEAGRLGGRHYAAVENLEHRLRVLVLEDPFEVPWTNDDDESDEAVELPVPTPADVAELYSYVEGLEMDVLNLEDGLAKLRDLLSETSWRRVEGEYQAKRQEASGNG